VRRHAKCGWRSIDEDAERRYWIAGVQDLIDKYVVYEEALPPAFWEKLARVPLTNETKRGLDEMRRRWERLTPEEQQTRINMPLAVALLQMIALEIERLQTKAALKPVEELRMHSSAQITSF
jgi:hypothetical protein